MRSVGRVRGLAVALGVGTALLVPCAAALVAPCGVAKADSNSSDSTSRAGKGAASADSESRPNREARPGTARASTPASDRVPAGSRAAASLNDDAGVGSIESLGGGNRRASTPRVRSSPPASAALAGNVAATDAVAAVSFPGSDGVVAITEAQIGEPAPVAAKQPQPAVSEVPPASRLQLVTAPLSAVTVALASASEQTPVSSPALIGQRSAVIPTDPSTTAAMVALALTTVLHMAVVLSVSALSAAPPSPFTQTPVLKANGLDIVASSVEEVTSFYGRWTYLPGAPGMSQGRQQFDVIDSATGQTMGGVDALVSRGTGIGYTAILVSSNSGTNVGTAAGQVPPVGSLIANFDLGAIGFTYSAMPAATGDVVSFVIRTPSGDIPLAMAFDAARGVADRTVDNRPIDLGNGFSIAPADPNAEILTAISGVLPLFTTVQGNQVFSVYDSAGDSVGSFEAVFTTTSDFMGIYTQAVMVTANDGVNVGTEPGQIPPVGSVYNVIYRESDEHSYLYSAMPAPAGNRISLIELKQGKVTGSAVTVIDGVSPPSSGALSAAGGYRFVPISDLQPSGINGLPPRDVQVQGYQQFDVFDSAGTRIGSVDANVSSQWDAFGIYSRGLMVAGVIDGNLDEVPPVGSVFNVVSSGGSGFASAHSVLPLPSGDVTLFKLVTPLGDIEFPSTTVPVAERTEVRFYRPLSAT